MSVNRREAIAQTTYAAVGALATFGSTARATGRRKSPNILFIMADDLGHADISCYGRREYRTPAIDSIAAGGMRFEQAYANSAVCSATRTGLITGRYQNRLPIGLEEPLAGRDVGLPPDHPTLPSLLRQAGYTTALIGKWHLGELPKYGPLKSGYDQFWGFRGGAIDYFAHDALHGPDLWDDDRPAKANGYLTDLLGDRAIQTIKAFSSGEQPFFLSLHFNAPHWPWEAPGDEDESKRIHAAPDRRRALFSLDSGSMATYAAIVTRMDYQIGRVLAALNTAGIADNTIVIFTSDNGGERFSDTWPFTGRKSELLEGGLRVPAIIRWPGHVKAATTSRQVMISMDWLPTLLAVAGGSPDPRYPTDGIDLGFAFSGAPERNRTLCWRYLNMDQQACRDGDLKYLKILGNTFLFNVVEDPMERGNLKDRMPGEFARLRALYDSWNKQMLPLDPSASTHGFTGAEIADHFGVKP